MSHFHNMNLGPAIHNNMVQDIVVDPEAGRTYN